VAEFTVTIDPGGANETVVDASHIEIHKKLNDVTFASFRIPNTSANRTLVATDQNVKIEYDAT